MSRFILASNSPRRRQLLEMLGIEYEVITSGVEEVIDPELSEEDLVMDLAFQKAVDIFRSHKEDVVLGFDTMVYIDGEALGKPKDPEDAKRMLRLLSGKKHTVVTGCAILTKKISKSFFEASEVTFFPMTETEIDAYVASKEPFDKAGAYAVQGLGSKFVKAIHGDFYTVMGLPVSRLYHELKNLDLLH
ncbi:MAG TPA: Maf family protein [Candidatus Izemoplasmatales bacterium]|nr:Maf family protein [Bacillota bacterium]HRY77441.1 Maf family protein [Candidatus Izemoplasmatales bacterium]